MNRQFSSRIDRHACRRGAAVFQMLLVVAVAAIILLGFLEFSKVAFERAKWLAGNIVDRQGAVTVDGPAIPLPEVMTADSSTLPRPSQSEVGGIADLTEHSETLEDGENNAADEIKRRQRLADLLKRITQQIAQDEGNASIERIATRFGEANERLKNWIQSFEEAEKAFKYNYGNPLNSEAERLAIARRFQQAAKGVMEAEDEMIDAANKIFARKGLLDKVTTGVGGIFALDGLLGSESKSKALIQNGKYDEAWRTSLGGAARYIVDSLMSVPNKLSGGASVAVGVALSEGADYAGQVLADTTLNPLNELFWDLYDRGYVPKPRLPRDYSPRNSDQRL